MKRSIACELLPWDTAFFGYRIGRVRGETLTDEQTAEIDEWSRSNQIRCLYFLARVDSPGTIQKAEDHDFRLVDVRLTFGCSSNQLPHPRPPSPGITIRQAQKADLFPLQTMARKAHMGSRFFNDPRFSPEKVEELYSTWITLDCEGRSARVLTVTSETNDPLGYVSCMMDSSQKAGQIGLIGVHPAHRGKGFGKCLVFAACEWLAGQGVKRLRVVTQGNNQAAQGLYQSCGFDLENLQLWYHKWYP